MCPRGRRDRRSVGPDGAGTRPKERTAVTTTVESPSARAWYPRLLGIVALVLAVVNLLDLLLTPTANATQFLAGHLFTGTGAQVATAVHTAFFAWVAWGCLTRRAIMVWTVMAYALYLAASVWIWTWRYGEQLGGSATTMLLINTVVTLSLLALARATFGRRHAFPR